MNEMGIKNKEEGKVLFTVSPNQGKWVVDSYREALDKEIIPEIDKNKKGVMELQNAIKSLADSELKNIRLMNKGFEILKNYSDTINKGVQLNSKHVLEINNKVMNEKLFKIHKYFSNETIGYVGLFVGVLILFLTSFGIILDGFIGGKFINGFQGGYWDAMNIVYFLGFSFITIGIKYICENVDIKLKENKKKYILVQVLTGIQMLYSAFSMSYLYTPLIMIGGFINLINIFKVQDIHKAEYIRELEKEFKQFGEDFNKDKDGKEVKEDKGENNGKT